VNAALEPLVGGPIARIDVGFALVRRAVSLRAAHHHRGRSPLSLPDCVYIAAAGGDGAVATADRAMLAAADAEGIGTVPLATPDR
jgi:hypothetical protein